MASSAIAMMATLPTSFQPDRTRLRRSPGFVRKVQKNAGCPSRASLIPARIARIVATKGCTIRRKRFLICRLPLFDAIPTERLVDDRLELCQRLRRRRGEIREFVHLSEEPLFRFAVAVVRKEFVVDDVVVRPDE